MEMRITTSQDWDSLEPYVRKIIRSIARANECYKLMKTFNDQIKELARLEWEERLHKTPSSRRTNLLDKINQELLELDKQLVIGTLFRT